MGVEPLFFRDRFVAFAFFRRRTFGDFHPEGDDEIAFRTRRKTCRSFPLNRTVFPCWDPGLISTSCVPTTERRSFFASEHHFGRIEFDSEMEVGTVPNQSLLFLWDGKMEVEVARSVDSFVPFSSEFYGHTVFDSGGNVHRFFRFEHDVPLTPAMLARAVDNFSRSPATRTSNELFHGSEYRLYAGANFPRAVTVRARLGFGSFFRSGTVAIGTNDLPLVGDFFLSAFHRLFKRDSEAYSISSPISRRRPRPPPDHANPPQKNCSKMSEKSKSAENPPPFPPKPSNPPPGMPPPRSYAARFCGSERGGVCFVHLFKLGPLWFCRPYAGPGGVPSPFCGTPV
jgi:hypothetical protein